MGTMVGLSLFTLIIIGQVEPKWLIYVAVLLTLAVAGLYLLSQYSIVLLPK